MVVIVVMLTYCDCERWIKHEVKVTHTDALAIIEHFVRDAHTAPDDWHVDQRRVRGSSRTDGPFVSVGNVFARRFVR